MPMVEKRDEDFKTHHIVNATGIQAVKTKLTGVIPAFLEESIKFYDAWKLMEDLPLIPFKEVGKISILVRKKRHYYILPSITRVHESERLMKMSMEMSQQAYYFLLGRAKKDEVVLGFLYHSRSKDTSIVMGIWPTENRKRYEMTDKDERQNLFLSDLKEFQKPKLWREVYLFTAPA